MKKNVGNFDAFLRSILAVILIITGLIYLEGIKGDVIGLIVTALAGIPLYMAITRKCIVFKLCNFSSITESKKD